MLRRVFTNRKSGLRAHRLHAGMLTSPHTSENEMLPAAHPAPSAGPAGQAGQETRQWDAGGTRRGLHRV